MATYKYGPIEFQYDNACPYAHHKGTMSMDFSTVTDTFSLTELDHGCDSCKPVERKEYFCTGYADAKFQLLEQYMNSGAA